MNSMICLYSETGQFLANGEELLRLLVPVIFVVIYIIGLIAKGKVEMPDEEESPEVQEPKPGHIRRLPERGRPQPPTIRREQQVPRPVPRVPGYDRSTRPQRPHPASVPQQPVPPGNRSPSPPRIQRPLEKVEVRPELASRGGRRLAERLSSPSGFEATVTADLPASAMAGEFRYMEIADLRKGIVMAEILGKPVALRSEDDRMF